jgi:hypothetical protein
VGSEQRAIAKPKLKRPGAVPGTPTQIAQPVQCENRPFDTSRLGDGTEMKTIVLVALALAGGASSGQADQLSGRAGTARFAAMSLINGQGARAVISNVLAPANGADFAPCQVQVSFFGPDGSLIGNTTTVPLKAGESTSVPASQPSQLVRATVSIGDVVDPAKVCELRTRVEIFDVQTDTTFVSVPGESIGRNSECSASSGRDNFEAVATTSSLSGGKASRKTRKSPVLATSPSTDPR